MHKIVEIIKSRLPRKKEAFEIKRLEICKSCEFNSDNKKDKFIINVFYKIINFMNTYCTICGCGIKYKVKVKTSMCSLHEIDREVKWGRILTNNL